MGVNRQTDIETGTGPAPPTTLSRVASPPYAHTRGYAPVGLSPPERSEGSVRNVPGSRSGPRRSERSGTAVTASPGLSPSHSRHDAVAAHKNHLFRVRHFDEVFESADLWQGACSIARKCLKSTEYRAFER